ncbi:unnamed protein product [Lepeophtheirus salmonis]|uniref:(salmon louse) hypothetical protein n=1 Tax=Lepeophtheirus salmonis TaxID=72036 RepID=A0A817FA87_LEPSM|nr:unnamed protein product [Lepeophtheirus salmonis]CAG9475080.1 unnamed protein product [Lepeophtheirus salmonis]
MCCMSESVKLKFHLVMSSIGFIGGIAGCLVFYIVYSNFHAGTWSLLAGLMAVICFQFHVFYRFDTLDSHYNEKHLYYFRNLGIFMFLMALIAIISYLVISATLGIPMLPGRNESYTCICSSISHTQMEYFRLLLLWILFV